MINEPRHSATAFPVAPRAVPRYPPAMNTPSASLRAAVVGAGYLGRFHAQKYAALPGVDLVAIVDVDLDRARAVAEQGLAQLREVLPGSREDPSVVHQGAARRGDRAWS